MARFCAGRSGTHRPNRVQFGKILVPEEVVEACHNRVQNSHFLRQPEGPIRASHHSVSPLALHINAISRIIKNVDLANYQRIILKSIIMWIWPILMVSAVAGGSQRPQ